jgi:hypothetical protein
MGLMFHQQILSKLDEYETEFKAVMDTRDRHTTINIPPMEKTLSSLLAVFITLASGPWGDDGSKWPVIVLLRHSGSNSTASINPIPSPINKPTTYVFETPPKRVEVVINPKKTGEVEPPTEEDDYSSASDSNMSLESLDNSSSSSLSSPIGSFDGGSSSRSDEDDDGDSAFYNLPTLTPKSHRISTNINDAITMDLTAPLHDRKEVDARIGIKDLKELERVTRDDWNQSDKGDGSKHNKSYWRSQFNKLMGINARIELSLEQMAEEEPKKVKPSVLTDWEATIFDISQRTRDAYESVRSIRVTPTDVWIKTVPQTLDKLFSETVGLLVAINTYEHKDVTTTPKIKKISIKPPVPVTLDDSETGLDFDDFQDIYKRIRTTAAPIVEEYDSQYWVELIQDTLTRLEEVSDLFDGKTYKKLNAKQNKKVNDISGKLTQAMNDIVIRDDGSPPIIEAFDKSTIMKYRKIVEDAVIGMRNLRNFELVKSPPGGRRTAPASSRPAQPPPVVVPFVPKPDPFEDYQTPVFVNNELQAIGNAKTRDELIGFLNQQKDYFKSHRSDPKYKYDPLFWFVRVEYLMTILGGAIDILDKDKSLKDNFEIQMQIVFNIGTEIKKKSADLATRTSAPTTRQIDALWVPIDSELKSTYDTVSVMLASIENTAVAATTTTTGQTSAPATVTVSDITSAFSATNIDYDEEEAVIDGGEGEEPLDETNDPGSKVFDAASML